MLMAFLMALMPSVVLLVGIALIMGVAYWRRVCIRSAGRQSPLSRDMLRPAGHSLRRRIEELDLEVQALSVAIFLSPLLVYSAYVSQSHFAGTPDSVLRVVLALVSLLILDVPAVKLLAKHLGDLRNCELGMEAELATAQELDQLMLDGCRVFHDIPTDYGNIDHVVVSRSGVFSVNTKAVRKSTDSSNAEVTVDHHENVIRFPERTCPIAVEQLQREGNWLSKYLSSGVGEDVRVEPLLALPGWYISKRIGQGAYYVFNPRSPRNFFTKKRQVLSPEMVQRVAHQLEGLCRDVAPSQREKQGWACPRGPGRQRL